VTDGQILHIGCYTEESGGVGEGITAAARDPETGRLTDLGLVAAVPSPSFLARHPRLPVLYAVSELAEGRVTAWHEREKTATVGDTGGGAPCHLAVTPDGRHLLSTNYASGSIAVHALDPDGAIGERTDLLVHIGHGTHPLRQNAAHAHMVDVRAEGDILGVDLGTDAVYPYALDAGRLVPRGPRVHMKAGMGPRRVARHPDGEHVYVVGELDGEVATYGRGWHERNRVPASRRPGPNQPSEIVVADDGRRLYVANRGPDSVSVFALDDPDALVPVDEVDCLGEWPRHIALIGNHLYVANERSHSIAVFTTGKTLAPAGEPFPSPSPTCVVPVDAGNAGFLAQ
jgi:6-phosphogluconolactonase (cycloisomerase 2 family)